MSEKDNFLRKKGLKPRILNNYGNYFIKNKKQLWKLASSRAMECDQRPFFFLFSFLKLKFIIFFFF